MENNQEKSRFVTNVNINAPIHNYYAHIEKMYTGSQPKSDSNVKPTEESICRAVERAMAEGLWYASTAWAVAFRIYQLKGYNGSVSQFVRDVKNWPFKRIPENWCTDDSISKPLRTGKLSGYPNTWKANGVQEQTALLGLYIMDDLEGKHEEKQLTVSE